MEENVPSGFDTSKGPDVSEISPDRNVPKRKSSIFNRRSMLVNASNADAVEDGIPLGFDISKGSDINETSPDSNVPKIKSSVFDGLVDDEENIQCSDSPGEMNNGSTNKPDFSIDAYIASLKKEVADWENLYKERKKIRTQERKRCRSNIMFTEEELFAMLPEEDKEFIRSRPDYNAIGREADEAMERAALSLQKAVEIEKSLHFVVNYVQETEKELRKMIVEMSNSE